MGLYSEPVFEIRPVTSCLSRCRESESWAVRAKRDVEMEFMLTEGKLICHEKIQKKQQRYSSVT